MNIFNVGDLMSVHGMTWRVDKVYPAKDGNGPSVGLVNPDNPNHGTTFFVSTLVDLINARKAARL